MEAHINHFLTQQPLQKCESTSTTSGWLFWSLWARLPGLVKKMNYLLTTTQQFATQSIQTGRIASLRSLNKRHLTGIVLLMVGVGATFAHQLFFDMYSEPHDVCQALGFSLHQCFGPEAWCFVSWYWYLDTIKFCFAAIFGAVGLILFVPTKYSLSFIPFSILQAFGWTYLIHFTFFTSSHETINAVPHWSLAAIGLSLGFAVVMSADYLLYWTNHKALGNWSRFVGVTEMQGLTPEQKEPMYQSLAKEFRQIQKTI